MSGSGSMRHAVLGAGGIGGLVAGGLAQAGSEVVLLMRPETLARYPGRITVESAVLGNFEVDVPAATGLDREVDVLWVATKAPQLKAALAAAPAEQVGQALVVPFLNGVDHMALLRSRYPNVAGAAIRGEAERIPPALIRHPSPFLRVDLAADEAFCTDLRRAGFECRTWDDELSLLWEKLVFLVPVALATTALDAPIGGVRGDDRFGRCREEALSVARAEGARFAEEPLWQLHDSAPEAMRSSMQKDVEAGRQPELEAIAGPITRGGVRHGIPTPATERLVELIRARTEAR
jgi:2-dehydropantoate 2-reductase